MTIPKEHGTNHRSFVAARKFVHNLGLKSQKEWKNYYRSGKKPGDIPSNPESKYKRQWRGWGDWLGSGNIAPSDRKFRPFPEAKEFVHTLGLKTVSEWASYRKSGKKPNDIPSDPFNSYKGKGWNGYGNWLGTGHVLDRNFESFVEARKYVHSLGLKNQDDWRIFVKSGKLSNNIPSNPYYAYKLKGWKGWGDWLGTGTIASYNRQFRSFEEARKFVRRLDLKSRKEWYQYCKSGKKPDDIPTNPLSNIYKKQWRGWGDWLNTHTVATHDRKYVEFSEAKEYVSKLGIKSSKLWRKYCQSGKKPKSIPAGPSRVYKKQWRGWGDWLGTGTIAPQNRQFRSFNQARKFVRSQELKDEGEWNKLRMSNKKPTDIPSSPSRVYKKEWASMGDWLGTGYVATQKRQFCPFEDAKNFVHSLGIKSTDEWRLYCKSGEKPNNIPRDPFDVYKNQWIDWPDWLGYEGPFWSVRRVKELLRALIESKVIYQMTEAVLYSFLLRKGVLKISGNRHEPFFKNLVEASRTKEGRKAIEDYAYSTSEIPPNLPRLAPILMPQEQEQQEEIQSASSEELAILAKQESEDPLDYGQTKTPEQILANTNILESISVDEEAMKFYLQYSINELWKTTFKDNRKTVLAVKNEGKNGNKYHDTVIETFLSDYEGTQNIRTPFGYSFPFKPNLMQLYVAYKTKTLPNFGNFSGTGAGKTLSAVLASRITDSKMIVIVCPNDVVEQWTKSITEIFPNSNVVSGKGAFYTKYSESKYQYLVLNYDKFSQEYSPNLILTLAKQKVDFVVLDEIHFVKKRDEDSSQRRKNLDGLMTAIRKKNNKVKVLGLSATPVVNNLMEGRSMLELITGKLYEDVAVSPTIPNAVTLYEKLSTISVRELPQYNIDLRTEHIDIEAERPRDIGIKYLKSNPLSIEQFLTDARIPEIVKHIEGQTIIYSEYVTDILEKLSKAVSEKGYSYALYTGSDRTGLARFLSKNVQVLIASRAISVGVDGLQHICNRLIINTLPWTNAQYQQLVGRLVRKGQIRDVVNVYIIKASVSGYPYDRLKWNRIQFKRTLADCAVDGRLPERNLITPQQAAMEAVKWLERLERGEVSSVTRRNLNVKLTAIQIQQRIRKYGDFTRLNNQINNEVSRTTQNRMIKDPRLWDEYHRQYMESRKTWSVIPYQEIIKKISKMPKRLHIGDFGCGEAKILEAFPDRIVHSFDYID
jgi:superfamily II DNA or RNA helicase